MLNDTELTTAIDATTAPRITKEYMESRILKDADGNNVGVSFTRFSETVTICSIHLDNGYSVRGESACVSPANYRQEIGEKISYDQAFNKLWALFGFVLAENIFQRTQPASAPDETIKDPQPQEKAAA